MKKGGHYDASGLIEAQFEPGSRGRVLKNLLGIKSKREMDQVEAQEQLRTLEELVRIYDQTHRFTAADVRKIHKMWLEPIYAWAGNYRRRFTEMSEIARAIAVVHTELLLIHPFREGNGRVTRLLAVLMALQAGLPPLDFGNIKGRKRQEYFRAVQAGLDRDYKPMEEVFSAVIRRTRRVHEV